MPKIYKQILIFIIMMVSLYFSYPHTKIKIATMKIECVTIG